MVSYRVRKGDTLGGIADRFSVETEDVRKWNHLAANRVSRGMVLRIYTLDQHPGENRARAREARKKTTHPAAVAQNRTARPRATDFSGPKSSPPGKHPRDLVRKLPPYSECLTTLREYDNNGGRIKLALPVCVCVSGWPGSSPYALSGGWDGFR